MNGGDASMTRVRIERLLPAPMETVFAAWTDPAVLSRWLSPTGRALAEADVREGGHFRIVMLGDGGMALEHTGRYLAVEPPRRLSFTWESPYTGPGPSIVTVTLHPQGRRTRLVLVHEGLPVATAREHENGWSTIVNNLATEVAGSAGPDRNGKESSR